MLHKDPFNELRGQFIETQDKGRKALEHFRSKLTNSSLCAFWTSPSELGREVLFALADVIKRKPATGWAKATEVSSTQARLNISKLEKEVDVLKAKLQETNKRDFANLFNAIEGKLACRCYRPFSHQSVLPHEKFQEEQAENVIELGMKIQKRKFAPLGGIFNVPQKTFAQNFCKALLHYNDYSTASVHALHSEHDFGSEGSFVLKPISEKTSRRYS